MNHMYMGRLKTSEWKRRHSRKRWSGKRESGKRSTRRQDSGATFWTPAFSTLAVLRFQRSTYVQVNANDKFGPFLERHSLLHTTQYDRLLA